ncbi:MAG TPA: hypothetical protein VMJ10_20950 [Kofleriaceae bacterium]|nr:hypothetical protein [Kofleriaceae bacterium]
MLRYVSLVQFGTHTLLVFVIAAVTGVGAARADDGALARYRKIWNPFSAGPELVSSADLQPRGQFFVRPYIYSEIAYAQYGGWSVGTMGLGQRLVAVAPQVELSYGILDWLEYEMYLPETSWWQSAGNEASSANGNGLGDITAFLKWRFHIQQPDSWLPSFTEVLFVTLPTSDWAGSIGTPPIPGGFAPLGRLPSTHFGAPELTDAILFRKNIRPFRLSGGIYYSYGLPTTKNGMSQYYGDIFQYRLAFEQFLDDTRGLAYAVELVGIHGLPFRLDGQSVDAGRTSFGLIGIEPTVEYNFTDRIVGAAGVLFTAAGHDDVAAIYPNVSLYYYFNPRGHVVAR